MFESIISVLRYYVYCTFSLYKNRGKKSKIFSLAVLCLNELVSLHIKLKFEISFGNDIFITF